MSGKAFVDTNVLVYAHNNSAGPKYSDAQRLLEELWNSGAGILSAQVLQGSVSMFVEKQSIPCLRARFGRLLRTTFPGRSS